MFRLTYFKLIESSELAMKNEQGPLGREYVRLTISALILFSAATVGECGSGFVGIRF